MINDLKYVVDNSEYVKINYDKIDEFINSIDNFDYKHWLLDLNLNLNEEKLILLFCLIESMNFCFWQKPKWKINYKDQVMSGSMALFYSILKEVENNKKFLNINYLYKLEYNDFVKLFISVEGELSLIKERYECFKEVVNYIYNNKDFYNDLYNIKSDSELLNYIISNFKYFDDKSIYKDRVLYFNKRANLLVNDLFTLSNKINSNIKNLDNIFGCADYGIPRFLRDYGIFIYNEELSNIIDNEIEIEHNSIMEIEIRSNMLYVIEVMKEKLNDKNIYLSSTQLDNIIWLKSKYSKKKGICHHTYTICY